MASRWKKLHKFLNFKRIVFLLSLIILILISLLLYKKYSDSNLIRPKNETVREKLQSCTKTTQAPRSNCFKAQLKTYVVKNGPGKTLEDIRRLNYDFGYNLSDEVQCHNFAHILGVIAAENSKNLVETISTCKDECFSGCYHGFFESLAKNPKYAEKSLITICNSIEDLSTEKYNSCLHAYGHYITEIYANDLTKSLQNCEQQNLSESYIFECYSGVFMQAETRGANFQYIAKSYPELPSEDNYLHFCSLFSKSAQKYCLEHGADYLYRLTLDAKLSSDFCIENSASPERCLFNLGGYFHKKNSDNYSTYIADNCNLRNKAYSKSCLSGAIASMIGAGIETDKITNTCQIQKFLTIQECLNLIR